MRKDQLDLITCYHCKEIFDHGDEICTIASRRFDDLSKRFVVNTTPVSIENSAGIFDLPSIDRCLNFHINCFEEIAGEDYLP